MTIEWDFSGFDLGHLKNLIIEKNALQPALEHVRDIAQSRAPILTGRLRTNGKTDNSGEFGRVYFTLIYARKQEQRDWQKHPHGGQARFLASAFATETEEVMRIIADQIF